MAIATFTYDFASNAQSWTSPGNPTGWTFSWLSTDGSPANGCLSNALAGKSHSYPGQVANSPAVTWETWGVPAGSTVTNVEIDFNWKVSAFTSAGTSNALGDTINNVFWQVSDGAFTVVYTSEPGFTTFAGTTAWATRTGSPQTVPPAAQASNSSILLRLFYSLSTANSSSASVIGLFDHVVIKTTYTAAVQAVPGSVRHRQSRQAPQQPPCHGQF